MEYLKITNKYYAKWLGVTDELMYQSGIHTVKSSQRDICQKGYPHKYDLYIFLQNERIIISYNDKTEVQLHALLENVKPGDKPELVSKVVKDLYNVTPRHNIICVFHHPVQRTVPVKKLELDDYVLFLEFFKTNHPDNKDLSWLPEYFQKIIDRGCVYGLIIDGRLAAVTDAPEMPYMESEVQEAGIFTLSEYRKRGYAKAVCTAAIASLLKQNICPIASLAADNVASERLAYSIGFKKLADVITVSLEAT
jgi:hypothetical protein